MTTTTTTRTRRTTTTTPATTGKVRFVVRGSRGNYTVADADGRVVETGLATKGHAEHIASLLNDEVAIRVAHIVHPAKKLDEVMAGDKTKAKALCGVFVGRRSLPFEGVCRECFDRYKDDDLTGGAAG